MSSSIDLAAELSFLGGYELTSCSLYMTWLKNPCLKALQRTEIRWFSFLVFWKSMDPGGGWKQIWMLKTNAIKGNYWKLSEESSGRLCIVGLISCVQNICGQSQKQTVGFGFQTKDHAFSVFGVAAYLVWLKSERCKDRPCRGQQRTPAS